MNSKDDPIAFLEGFHALDRKGLIASLREHLQDGTFDMKDSLRARWRIFLLERDQDRVDAHSAEGLAKRQTRAAELAAWAAIIAVGVSLVALGVAVLAYIKPPEQPMPALQAAPISASPIAGMSPPTTPAAASRPSPPQSR